MAVINGTNNNDILYGTTGDDEISGLEGNDTINGDMGTDVAVFAGQTSDYQISLNVVGQTTKLTIKDINLLNGNEGTDTLQHIEYIRFSDRTWQIFPSRFLVNSTTGGNQINSTVAALADGGFVVTWVASGSGYGQRYNSAGNMQGNEFLISNSVGGDWLTNFSGGYSLNPVSVTAMADGGFVATWQSGDYGIYAQRYSSTGTPVSNKFLISTYVTTGTTRHDENPTITALADGGFIVAWQFEYLGANSGIYGRRYNSAGNAVGSEFVISESNQLPNPSITALNDGGFVVTWQSADVNGYGIYGQRYNNSGVATGVKFRANTYFTSNQISAAVTALTDGGFVVVWSSDKQDGQGGGIYGQRYNSLGVAVGTEFWVNTTATNDQAEPTITTLANGGFVVAWQSVQNGGNYDTYGRRYDSTGSAIGSEFLIATVSDKPAVEALADGGFVVTGQSWGMDGSGNGIYAQRFNVNGERLTQRIVGSSLADIMDFSTNTSAVLVAGGVGDDTYVVGLKELVIEDVNEGTDTIKTSISYALGANIENLILTGTSVINGTGNILSNVLTGNSGNNILDGGLGNDTLDGGTGNNTLIGGAGNDTYVVNAAGNVVTENANEGTDTVQSSISYTLGTNLENLTLTGAAVINGTGNTSNNLLTGNAADNILDGGVGSDSLTGGAGNDTYIVDVAGDVITENVNEGTDSVQSSVTYTLSANLENLTLTGVAAINGTGNTLNNVLRGNSGNNTLNGGAGNDTLDGGAGTDSAVYQGNAVDYKLAVSATGDLLVTDGNTANGDEGTDVLNGVETLQFADRSWQVTKLSEFLVVAVEQKQAVNFSLILP